VKSAVLWGRLELSICTDSTGGVDLTGELLVLLKFESVCYLAQAFMFHVALFKDEWSVLLHSFAPLGALARLVLIDFYLLNRHQFFAFELKMQLDSFSGFPGHHVVKLSSEIFGREREILSEDHLAKNVLSI